MYTPLLASGPDRTFHYHKALQSANRRFWTISKSNYKLLKSVYFFRSGKTCLHACRTRQQQQQRQFFSLNTKSRSRHNNAFHPHAKLIFRNAFFLHTGLLAISSAQSQMAAAIVNRLLALKRESHFGRETSFQKGTMCQSQTQNHHQLISYERARAEAWCFFRRGWTDRPTDVRVCKFVATHTISEQRDATAAE